MTSRNRTLVVFFVAVVASSVLIVIGDHQESYGAFPGENGQIVFLRDDGSGGVDIWVTNPDGTGLQRLTDTPDDYEYAPTWSPDGYQVAYINSPDSGGNAEVWVMDHDGSNPQQVTDLPGNWGARHASWAPDGNRLVVEVEYWGASFTDLYAVDLDGSGLTQITDYEGSEMHPAWSPDGSRIAFYSYELATNPADIWTVAPDGSDLTQITNDPKRFHDPTWSPDGSQIACSEYDGLNFSERIWVMDADGSNAIPITEDEYNIRRGQPAWSPDGTQLVYTQDGELWVMGGDGSVPTALGVDGFRPDWQPVHHDPIAVDDGPYDASEGRSLMVAAPGVLENDTDPDGDPLTAVQMTDALHGTALLDEDGSFTYTPELGFSGTDSFTYRAEDPGGLTSGEATVTIEVQANAAPVAEDDSYIVLNGETLTLPAPGVLGNDTDLEDGRPATAMKLTDPGHGTVTLNRDGSFTYRHDGSEVASDAFAYQAMDSSSEPSNPATVTFTIETPPPPPPPPEPPPAALVPHTVGLVDAGTGEWHLRNQAGVVSSFGYGNPGDLPIAGDWDGDGVATPGLYRQSDGFFYSRNSNTTGVADAECFAGDPSDVPIAGDWDGDGDDNLGIYRPSEQRFYLFTSTCTGTPMGAAQISFLFGNPGDNPVAGDWNGDGIDEVGLHRESTGFFYWRNTLDTGVADGEIFFGDPGDRFVSGDWGTVDGRDTPGLFRPSDVTFYFRHTLTQGVADSQFTWTGAGSSWLPVAGDFGLG